MINANELRRNNWILEGGKPIRVDEIRHWYFGDAEPIPLTPEILEKAGFKNGCPYSKEYGYTAPKEAFFFENDYYPNEMSNGRSIGKEIEYLHQLQNLYFALTGEELTINL